MSWYNFNVKGPGIIKVSILNQVPTGLKKQEFMTNLKNLIENESKKLLR